MIFEDERKYQHIIILDGFQTFLLFQSGNPANTVPTYTKPRGVPNFWAASMMIKLLDANKFQLLWEKPIVRWAIIEEMNGGSHQRETLDNDIAMALHGSGRWGANDQGGQFRRLRVATILWLKETDHQKQLWAWCGQHVVGDFEAYAYDFLRPYVQEVSEIKAAQEDTHE